LGWFEAVARDEPDAEGFAEGRTLASVGRHGSGARLCPCALDRWRGTLLALALFALLVVLLFPLREHLPDLWAAVMLKAHQVQQVTMDGTVMQVRQIGWLVTTLQAGEMELRRPNREVLRAFLQKAS
jgi:hypothetical protein